MPHDLELFQFIYVRIGFCVDVNSDQLVWFKIAPWFFAEFSHDFSDFYENDKQPAIMILGIVEKLLNKSNTIKN